MHILTLADDTSDSGTFCSQQLNTRQPRLRNDLPENLKKNEYHMTGRCKQEIGGGALKVDLNNSLYCLILQNFLQVPSA